MLTAILADKAETCTCSASLYAPVLGYVGTRISLISGGILLYSTNTSLSCPRSLVSIAIHPTLEGFQAGFHG